MKARAAPRPVGPQPRMAARTAALPRGGLFLRHPELWYVAGIFLAGFAIYWRSLSGPFLFDDADLLEPLSAVRLKNWYIILTGPRPLLILSYALNHWLTRNDPFYFHLVSVILHCINTVILWRIVRLVTNSPGLAGWLTPAARNLIVVFAPLLFLASPIQTESVAYISSRSEVLAATFYLLALLVFLSAWREKRPWSTAALVGFFYGCAVSSKQHALTLPGAILLLDYFFVAGGDWRRLRANWRTYALLAVEVAVGGFIVVRAVINVPSAGFFLKEVTWKDYLFTQFRMYFLYLRLLLVPFGLNADYDIRPSRTLLEHGSWLALAGIVTLAGGAVYFRRRLVLPSFGLLFYFLTLFPTSAFFPLLDYAAERRLYLPSLGFFLAVLGLACEWRISRRELGAGLGAILIVYGAGTWSRNRVWQDELALWQDVVEKSPGKWRAHNNLGEQYSRRKMFAPASREFQRAAELVPPNTMNQAQILSSLGSTFANRRMYAEAIAQYQSALKISPEISTLWTNLAIAEIRLNRPEGWEHFEKAMGLNDLAWEPHFARGNLYYELGRYDDAIKDYRRVLRLRPDHADARYNLQAALAMKGLKGQ